jgi:hypothetical protein
LVNKGGTDWSRAAEQMEGVNSGLGVGANGNSEDLGGAWKAWKWNGRMGMLRCCLPCLAQSERNR